MSKQPKRIALVLPKTHDYAVRLLEGVLGAVKDRNAWEFVEILYDEVRSPGPVYSVDVAGALVWTAPGNSWVLDFRDRGVHVVSLNSEWIDAGIPSVGSDLDAVVEKSVEHLAKLGRRHAAYIGHMMAASAPKLRMRNLFVAAANRRRWTTATLEVPGIPSSERQRLAAPAAEAHLIAFLRHLPRPAVVFCDDDYVAALVCRVAEHLRLTVPGDLAVLGNFDMMIARFSVPTISSMPGSGQLVGAAGVELLADLLAGKRPPTKPIFVPPPDVVARESTGGETRRDDDIRRVNDMIKRFACAGLSVDQLLTRVAVSQKTLNKRFEAVYGRTPGAAIRRVRAERACELLVTTTLSIGRIAGMVGFDEPSNFNLFFKREVGCTPGEYRATQGQAGASFGKEFD